MGADRGLFRDVNHLSAATGWAHGVMAAYARWGGLVALTVLWAACRLVAAAGTTGSGRPRWWC